MSTIEPPIRLEGCVNVRGGQSRTPNMKIVDEFNFVYEERLENCGKSLELKNSILQEWIADLKVQNAVLITSIENLENVAVLKIEKLEEAKNKERALVHQADEAGNRVAMLEEKLMWTVKEHQSELKKISIDSCNVQKQISQDLCKEEQEKSMQENCLQKAQINTLTDQLHIMETRVAELTAALCRQDVEKCKSEESQTELRSRIQLLEEERDILIHEHKQKDDMLIRYARETTVLKREAFEAKKLSEGYHQLLNEVERLKMEVKQKACALEKAKAHIEELHSYSHQLRPTRMSEPGAPIPVSPLLQESLGRCKDVGASGDSELSNLRTKLESQRDLQMALTAEVADKHDTILSLKEQNHELEEKLRQTEMQAHFKDDIIRELRKEVKLGRAKLIWKDLKVAKDDLIIQLTQKFRNDESRSTLSDLNEPVTLITVKTQSCSQAHLPKSDKADKIG